MSIELITGYGGRGHISSADAGRFNAGICGIDKYVLNTGTKFEYNIESNNLITIGSGDAVNQGRHISIPQNSTENVAIENGSQNKARIDVIALRYKKDLSTGIEEAETVVIKGTESILGASPIVPNVTKGNIFDGDPVDDLPIYHVLIEGMQITSVSKAFSEIPSLSGITEAVYPVGSIYMSVNETNPKNLFGGTWTEIQGRFLLGRSSDFAAGNTGGSKEKTIGTDNMPAHNHKNKEHSHKIKSHSHAATSKDAGEHTHKLLRAKNAASGTARYSVSGTDTGIYKSTEKSGAHKHDITINGSGEQTTENAGADNTENTGGGKPLNIMPPYLAVYMWERTE